MKRFPLLRRVQAALLFFYRQHPAMAQRTRRFKIIVSLLLLFSLGIMCSAFLAA